LRVRPAAAAAAAVDANAWTPKDDDGVDDVDVAAPTARSAAPKRAQRRQARRFMAVGIGPAVFMIFVFIRALGGSDPVSVF
jgi:hypothetical protein